MITSKAATLFDTVYTVYSYLRKFEVAFGFEIEHNYEK